MTRNPLADPMPGDIFLTIQNHRVEIIDRYVSVDEHGKETPCLVAKRIKVDNEIHDILNTSVSVISVKIRGSKIEYQSTENDISWKSVKRIDI
jgi:hypothetical protein